MSENGVRGYDTGKKVKGRKRRIWVKETCGWVLKIVRRDPNTQGSRTLPRRWVVERTFGWLNHCRRLSKDYEGLTETSEAMVYAAMVRLMARHPARRPQAASP